MVKLAELAGIDPATALLHRAAWQADDPASRVVMSRILATWMEAPPRNPLAAPKSVGAAAVDKPDNSCRVRYIMERIHRGITLWMEGLNPPAPMVAT
jgi:hypothetical protein